jgi:hypothetical protein
MRTRAGAGAGKHAVLRFGVLVEVVLWWFVRSGVVPLALLWIIHR